MQVMRRSLQLLVAALPARSNLLLPSRDHLTPGGSIKYRQTGFSLQPKGAVMFMAPLELELCNTTYAKRTIFR